jgi:uncharacterized sulfatase
MSTQSLSRRTVLKGLAGAALAGRAALSLADDAEQQGLNVLFISVDDLNHCLGCYGNEQVRTPNIDRFSTQALRFTRAYAQWPSCLPSRASFLSGWSPRRTGVVDFSPGPRDGALKKVTYLPQHFKDSGYHTARLDKIFHIGRDDPASWTLTEEPYRDDKGRFRAIWTGIEVKTLGLQDKVLREGRYPQVRGEKGTYRVMDCDDEDLFDGKTARRAVQLLKQRASDQKRFFLGVGFRRPHLPWLAPKKYFDMYPPEEIQLPPAQPGFDKPFSDRVHREMIAHYYAATSFMDAQVGKVLDALRATGLDRNTIVFLFGDQGYHLGERDGFFSKGNLWERSLLVPLLVAAPSCRRAGQSCDRPVALLDMYPTLVDLCGLAAPPSPLDGDSFAGLLTDAGAAWRDWAVSYSHDKRRKALSRTIRTPRYRYTERSDGAPMELIDYREDPYEWRNLVDSDAHADLHTRMRAMLRKAVATHPTPKS